MSPEALLSALTRLVDDLTELARPIIISVQADERDDINALLAERYAAAGLAPDAPVMTIVTVLGDAEPKPYQALPLREPALEPVPQPEPDPLVLARIMRMARARRLKAHHTGPDIYLRTADGEIVFGGTLLEVYQALKADTIAQLPPDPVAELRERLARAAYLWTLQDDGDGQFTLCRGDPPQRMFSGTLEHVTAVAASRILNTVPNWGYPE